MDRNSDLSGWRDRSTDSGPNVQIGGLAYDPAAPDTVYIGLVDFGTPVSPTA